MQKESLDPEGFVNKSVKEKLEYLFQHMLPVGISYIYEYEKLHSNLKMYEAVKQYSGPIPREETDKIANIIVHNEGYPHHIDIMKMEKMDKTVEKKQVKEIDQQLAKGPKTPDYTPNKPEPKNKGKGEGRG